MNSTFEILLQAILKYNKDSTPSNGVMDGKIGISLLFAIIYDKCKNQKVWDYSEAHLNGFLNDFRATKLTDGFYNGLPGILWALRMLIQQEFIDEESIQPVFDLSYLDEQAYLLAEKNISNKNIDFLYGGIGYLKYLSIDSLEKKNLARKIAILKLLDETKTIDDNGIFWVNSKVNELKKGYIDLGMAHGLPSLISAISDLIGSDLENLSSFKHIVVDATRWLIDKQLKGNDVDIGLYGCAYPYTSSNSHSPLAWCYGDLGVLFALVKANTIIQSEIIRCHINKILINLKGRRVKLESGLADISICHGSSGLFFLLNTLRIEYGISSLEEDEVFWIEHTILQTNLFLKNNTHSNPGILNGLSGILLALGVTSNDNLRIFKDIFLL